MVASPPKLEVRAVGPEAFDDVAPLLELFENRKMSREDWRAMLFTYPWWDGPVRGYALYAGDVAVGFLGTIFSSRLRDGVRQTFCNTSCWIVRDAYRHASILLLRPVLAMRDCTIVNWTPTERSYDIFAKLGFRPLESQTLLLPPLAAPWTLRGSYANDPATIAADLRSDEREIRRDLASRPDVRHVVLRAGERRCYVVASRRAIRGIPVADVHYVGDPDLFRSRRGLAHLALFRTLGTLGIALDKRFWDGPPPVLALRRPARRLYRPVDPTTPPTAVDGLFSEAMTLRL